MRALIFGGTGQIGRALAIDMAQAGWRVEAVVRGRPLAPEVLALGVKPVQAGATGRRQWHGNMMRWSIPCVSRRRMRRI